MSVLRQRILSHHRVPTGLGIGQAAVLTSGGVFAVGLAFLLVHRSPALAVVVLLLPFAVWVLARSYGGLITALVLVLVLPSWLALGTPQITVLRIASLAAACTFLVRGRIRLHPTDYALLFLICDIVLCWLLQYNYPHVGRIVSVELTPVGFYLGARALPPTRIPLLINAILLAGAVGGLIVVYEYLHGSALFINPNSYDWNPSGSTIFRPGGTFGSPPGASTVLCVVVLLGVGAWMSARGRRAAFPAICTGIAGIAVILTFTRAALIGGALGVVLLLWLARSPLLRPLRLLWIVTAVILFVFVLVPKLQSNRTFSEGFLRAGTLTARESYWHEVLPIATANTRNLFLGVGTGAFEAATNGTPVSAQLASVPDVLARGTHNEYVETTLEQGLLGLFALLAFLAVAFASSVRTAFITREPLYAAFAAAILAIAVIMTVDNALLTGPSFAFLMLMAGLSANLASERSLDRRSVAAAPEPVVGQDSWA